MVYKDLRTQGLVQDRNLGQAVSRFNHEHKSPGPTSVEITTASGKTVSAGSTGRSGAPNSSRGASSSDDDGRGVHTSSARSVQGNGSDGSGDAVTGGRAGGASHGGGRGK